MAIDASIFNNANRPTVAPITPAEAQGQALDIANKLQAITKFKADQAIGQAYQQATGPDGTLDTNKLRSIIAQDPMAALGAQRAQEQAESLQTSQQARALKYNDYLNATLPSLLKLPDDQLHDAAAAAMDRAVDAGIVPRAQASATLAKLPSKGAELRTTLNQLGIAALPPGAQRDAIYGRQATRNDGQSIQSGLEVPADQPGGGGFVPSSATRLGLSPAEQASQQTGTDPDTGAPTATPLSTRLIQQGRGDLVNPGSGVARPGRVPASLMPPGYTGRPQAQGGAPPPPTAAPVNQDAPAPVPAASQPASGAPVVTGISPAKAAAQKADADASIAAFHTIADQGVQAQARGATLDNMLGASRQFSTGPLADRIARLREIGGRFGINVDKDATSAAEEFNKLAANLASQQGAGSDARLSVAQAGNPHSDLSPEGVDLMLRQLRGNEDYLQARAKLAAGWRDNTDRRGFENQVGSQLDPRTFQYDRMTGPQKLTFFNNLGGKPEQAAFMKAHARAEKLLGGGP